MIGDRYVEMLRLRVLEFLDFNVSGPVPWAWGA